MKLFKKRILPLALAVLMAMSVAVPAFAADGETEAKNTETKIDSSFKAADIDVFVPETGTAYINPLGLPVKLDDDNKIVGQQIVTTPMFLVNNGDTAMKVSATVTGAITPSADPTIPAMKFVTSAAAITGEQTGTTTVTRETGKAGFIYFQMATTRLEDDPYDDDGFTDEAYEAIAGWNQAYSEKDIVLQNGKAVKSAASMVTLSAATITPGSSGGDPTITYNPGSIAMFRLAGLLVEEPKTPWDANDKFSASVAFTFKPDTTAVEIEADDDTTIDNSAGSATLGLTAKLSDESLTIESVDWTSGTEATATVAGTGTPENDSVATVTAVADGTTVITAKVTANNGVTYTGTVTITVENT